MKTLYENLGGTYREENGVFLPNLELPKQLTVHIGKYGQMRLDFLKKHRRGTYTTLLTEGRLAEHLSIIGEEARSMVDDLTSELAKKRGIDEHLKATNSLLMDAGNEQLQGFSRRNNHRRKTFAAETAIQTDAS